MPHGDAEIPPPIGGGSPGSDPATPAGRTEDLLGQVYKELRSLAATFLAQERAGHTLQPTALVHEAYLRLAKPDSPVWQGRAHFLAAAAEMMRRVLVDHARQRLALKRNAPGRRVALDSRIFAVPGGAGGGGVRAARMADTGVIGPGRPPPRDPDPGIDLLELDSALQRLAALDQRKARVVELKVFGGLTGDEVASYLGVSRKTVVDDWSVARAWLTHQLSAGHAT